MFTKYAINITADPKAEVQLLDGRLKIAIDGWQGITEREEDHDDIVFAVRRKWIRLDEAEPKSSQAPVQPKPYQAEQTEAVQAPTIESTPIGKKAAKKE